MSLQVSALRSARAQRLIVPALPARLTSRAMFVALVVVALPLIVHANRPLEVDVWWALAFGRDVVSRGALPTSDPFTFSLHAPQFVDAQWLTQLVFFGAYLLGRFEAVMALTGLVSAASVAIVLYASWRRSGSLPAAVGSVALFTLPALWYVYPRAQTLVLLPFALTYCVLLCARPGVRALLMLVASEIVWANLHGSFFLAPVLTALVLVAHASALRRQRTGVRRCASTLASDPRVRFLVIAGLAQTAATFATPYGIDLYRYAINVAAHPFVRQQILEWLPTTVGTPDGVEFFAALGVVVLIVARSRRAIGPLEVVLLGTFTVMGLQAFRNVIWLAVVAPPLMAPHLAELHMPALLRSLGAWARRPDRSRAATWRVLAFGVFVVVSLPVVRGQNPFVAARDTQTVAEVYPQAAAAFLLEHDFGPHVLADHYWGAYLDWQLAPRYQPMVDSSIDIHPMEVWHDFVSIQRAHVSWESLVDQYDVDVLMLSHENQTTLIQAAAQSPRWRQVYEDPQTTIFVRTVDHGVMAGVQG